MALPELHHIIIMIWFYWFRRTEREARVASCYKLVRRSQKNEHLCTNCNLLFKLIQLLPTKGFLREEKITSSREKKKYWFNQRFSVTLQSTIFSFSSNSLDWSYLRSYQNILHKSKRQVTLFYLTWCLFLVFQGLTPHFLVHFCFFESKIR